MQVGYISQDDRNTLFGFARQVGCSGFNASAVRVERFEFGFGGRFVLARRLDGCVKFGVASNVQQVSVDDIT